MKEPEDFAKLVKAEHVPFGDKMLEVLKATSPKSLCKIRELQLQEDQPPAQDELDEEMSEENVSKTPIVFDLKREASPFGFTHYNSREEEEPLFSDSEDEESSFDDHENLVFNLGVKPGEAFVSPERFEVGDESCYQEDSESENLYGKNLYAQHNLIFRVFPKPSPELNAVKQRNNNGRLVKTINHHHYDYLCNLEGGRFEYDPSEDPSSPGAQHRSGPIPREHHFGPTNHFGNILRSSGNDELAINEEGVTRFGPNFARPIQDFYNDYNNDEEPTVEVK